MPGQRAFHHSPVAGWGIDARLMFGLSSEVSNQKMPRTLLHERRWRLPREGACKLFIQGNNSEVVSEVTAVYRGLKHNVDSLIDIVGQIDLGRDDTSYYIPIPKSRGIFNFSFVYGSLVCLHKMQSIISGLPKFDRLVKHVNSLLLFSIMH